MVAHPAWDTDQRPPVVLWMHGRTSSKEIDPGRYLRWIRAGLGVCAIDLPGHGERVDAALQPPTSTLAVVGQMVRQLDGIVTALSDFNAFNMTCTAIGGISAGGMAALARLCKPHSFVCASVEATSGSWRHLRAEALEHAADSRALAANDPMQNLNGWREIPLQVIHTRADQWMPIQAQEEFVAALRQQYAQPNVIEFIQYEQTGAPHEHLGFGRMAADAKNRQAEFLKRHLAG